jgi:meso-butanediol dehydrogenase/(S,S)-butanediol dehydrogenase/diacetyl reductase
MSRFSGKVVLVTGAASGMGRATALRLAAEGGLVYALDVNAAGLEETLSSIRTSGAEAHGGVHDVRTRAACAEAVAACVSRFERLDVLLNVAGVIRFGHVPEVSEEDWNLQIAVNLSGPFFLSQEAIPHLLKVGGNIVNIASNAGLMGQAYTVAYCASKAGLINMSRAMAMEFAKSGVRINCVAPAGTATEMLSGISWPEGLDDQLMARYRGFRGMSPAGDIVNVIAFLASDEAKAVHGAVWEADQGVTAG